jgi:hypothetical protein
MSELHSWLSEQTNAQDMRPHRFQFFTSATSVQGPKRKWPRCIGRSALLSTADTVRPPSHVRLVPTGDSSTAVSVIVAGRHVRAGIGRGTVKSKHHENTRSETAHRRASH